MLQFLKSTTGRKYLMGATGLIWIGFVLSHMAGNMLILVSPELYNSYGHAIVSNKLILYTAEIGLVLALIVHVVTAISLTRQNKSAKGSLATMKMGSRYAIAPSGEKKPPSASQYMGIQGSIVLAFVILHLITFKYGTYYETTVNGVVMRDLHRLVVETFHNVNYIAWYSVSLVLLMFHLSHGANSVFLSFGVLERKMQVNIKKLAWLYAVIVTGGFLSQPLYVFIFHR